MEKSNKCKWKIALGVIVSFSIVLLIYLAFAFYFKTHYLFHTSIDNISSSCQTVSTVEEMLNQIFKTYMLHVTGRENTEVVITADEVSLVVDTRDTLQSLLESQNVWLWPISIWKDSSYELEHIGYFDEQVLDTLLDKIPFLQSENMNRPENAYIGAYQETTGEFELVEAYAGTFLRKGKVLDCIKNALENMDSKLNLEDAGCYIDPSITSKDEKLRKTWMELNKQVSAQITYVFGDQEEIVDALIIQNWLTHVNGKVYLDELEVGAYIKELSKKYDTAYRSHNFTTAEGNDIKIDSGFYGWRIDRELEKQELIDLISQGAVEIREPRYLQTAASHGEHDYGNTYVEINLSKQHLYFWENGNIIIESDFVSGNVARGMGTPAGIFPVTYKERNAVLRGTNYETPVSYWMPFNGGIGMHDASWRREFGGIIYETNGSHGCINLPLEAAKEIYEHIEAGMPVICYYE